MATFEESVAEQQRLHELKLRQIQEEVDARLEAEKRIAEDKVIALRAQEEAIKRSMEAERAANGETSEAYQQLLQQQIQLREEANQAEEDFQAQRSDMLDKEEKKAKKRHGAAIARIRMTQAAYEGVKGIVSATFELLKETVLESEKVAQSFRRSTGGSQAFVGELQNARKELAFFGKGTAEAEQMLMTLNEGFMDFQRMSTTQREELIGLTATVGQLGIGTDVVADSMNLLVGQFGMGVEAVKDFNLTMLGTAENMGMDPGALGRQTIDLAAGLARLGPRAVGTALEFAKLERQFGVSAESLIQFSDKFDTFEGAQDVVGQLNATFGTTLNSMDLMQMKEEDRAIALMKNLKQSGVNFKQLSKFQKQNLAEVTGMSEADLERLSISRKAFDTARMEQEEAEARSIKFMSIMDKIKAFFMRAVINVQPLVEALIKLGDEVLEPLLSKTKSMSEKWADLSKEVLGPFGEYLFSTGKFLFENIIPGLQNMADAAIPKVIGALQKMMPFLNTMKDVFGMLIEGDFEGAFGKFSAAVAPMIAGIGKAVYSAIKEVAQSKKVRTGLALGGLASGALMGAKIGLIGGPMGAALGASFGALAGTVLGAFGPQMMQHGGVAHGGMTMVGEKGPELLNLPRGAFVTSNNMMRHGVTPPGASSTTSSGAGAKGATINMYMDGKKISSAVMARINEENNIVMA